jgi:threonine aldolase
VDVSQTGVTPERWVKALAERGLLVRPWARKRLRCVLHRHISDDDVAFAAHAFRSAAAPLGLS